MRDSSRRVIDYVRVSITDRCNLRCVYCMPEEGTVKRAHAEILTYEEIIRVITVMAGLGVSRVKLTGGEPLVRRGATDLARRLKAVPGVASLTLTTNGTLLPEAAADLRRAGVDGVNVSLDTLDPERYRRLTRGGDVRQAVAGVDAALAAGIPAVKINCVPLVDAAEADILALAAMARARPVHVRFIEIMPMGQGREFGPVERTRLRTMLEAAYGPLVPCNDSLGNGPARYWTVSGFAGKIGFIDTLDHGICSRCNRVRLTADGVLKTCLHMDQGVSLRPLLAEDDTTLAQAIVEAVRAKPPHHRFSAPGAEGSDARTMSQIGG